MEFIFKIIQKIKQASGCLLGMLLLVMSHLAFSETIIISPNTVISHSKSYQNATLDMSNGSFIIRENATLTIKNSIISGNLSKKNPVLINVEKGSLNLVNNQVNIKSVDVAPHPLTQSLYHAIQVGMGGIILTSNHFQVDQPFTVGLLITTATLPTKNFSITNNKIERFHGALYLIGTDHALVSGNTLIKNTYGNIVMIGSNSKIINNSVFFSGNNRLGDSIDVIDSNNILVSKNLIFTPTCHGIYIFNSQDISVDQNRVFGGITYGMNILTYPEFSPLQSTNDLIKKYKMKNTTSTNISVTNNFFSQNRYGIAASDIRGLTVNNNTFVQRFENNDARKFWTDNNVLFKNITDLIWTNNKYKEGYTQVIHGNNANSSQIITFPQSGGVSF